MSYSFVRLYLSYSFLIILYVFGSDFYHSLCLCLVLTLFFHCLKLFCFEKQVSEFLATHFEYLCELLVLATRFGDLQVASPSHEFTQKDFATHSRLASRETPRISFLKSFSWKTCLKPLLSFLKPLFQYFYIKTQPIWIFFHSINISNIILNSFHWFWFLDYVLKSFVLLVEIFITGVGKT